METQFHKNIEELNMKILHMAAYAERAVSDACTALINKNIDLADQVIEKDTEINDIELEIDEFSLLLLAREQPVARDLRFITGCRRAVIDLERIGDEAVNISEKTIYLSKLPEVPHNPMLQELVDTAQDMLRTSVEAFKEENAEKAADVCRMDYKADDLNVRILKKTMDDMVTEVTGVRRAVNTILAARSLERIGDLATNIAETTIFISEGITVKHNCERF
ncbi:phosphate signaling complex protein PhoU [Desulfovibrio ferrophilus]|uniref:Phosphate-specific transport system accessory protein PhoU n=1 Tax=Desulfovibrio ferrophilus TaxID=241368 RepID=A0A2Z6B3B2_9BACT|nr:phosphate signaling complex protein PhoU [Desulfovibrio ferrophilus]BBD09935.1 phosphate-specific transport system accessory protein PhoU [Desulfovibrio ferrophilus]